MKRGPIIHGVLLLAMLLFAYQTWTREEKVERKTGDITIWSFPQSDLTAVLYDTKSKTVRVEQRSEGNDTYLWGVQTLITRTKKAPPVPEGAEPVEETETTTREFAVGDKGEEMWQHMADLRAMRALGDPSDEDLKEFGLEGSEENITVTHKGGSKSLVVGGKVYGGQDRYVRDPGNGKVYVVAGEVLNDLLTGESSLRIREVHEFEDDAVARAKVTAAGKDRELVRVMVDDEQGKKTKNWALASAPDKPDQTMANFLKSLDNLRPTRFEPELDAKDLNLVVKAEYMGADGKKLGWLELYEKEEPAEEPAKPAETPAAPTEGGPADGDAAKPGEAAAAKPGEAAAAKPGEPAAAKPGEAAAADAAKPADADKPAEPAAADAAKPTPAKKTYYLRTELTRTYALVPMGAATRVTEDIGQIFTE